MFTPDEFAGGRWRKSSFSNGEGGACVELSATLGAVRDSKNPNGGTLRADLTALLTELKRPVRKGDE
jgi:hypothetical protein